MPAGAPERPEDGKGVKGFFMKMFMKRAGSAVPSANRISLLRDGSRHTFAEGLNSPFGMALVGNDFYVANTDAVVKFRYEPGATAVPLVPPRRNAVSLPIRKKRTPRFSNAAACSASKQ